MMDWIFEITSLSISAGTPLPTTMLQGWTGQGGDIWG